MSKLYLMRHGETFLIATGIDPKIALQKHFGNCSILIFNYQDSNFKLKDIVNP